MIEANENGAIQTDAHDDSDFSKFEALKFSKFGL